jgi:P2-related tail formation protein
MLENKLLVLKSLNTTVEGDSDSQLTFNVQGTNKAVKIDLEKLKEAITFVDGVVEEKQASAADHMTKVEDIDLTNVTEEEFIEKAVKAIGEIKKNENKTLSKDSFIRIFKYTGDFAKLRSRGMKAKAQEERIAHFDSNHQEYLKALQANVQAEEKAYEASSQVIFDKLFISQENFERSQQQLMQDPSVQMELFNLGIKME